MTPIEALITLSVSLGTSSDVRFADKKYPKMLEIIKQALEENEELKEKSKEYDALLKEIKVRKLAARTKYIANPNINTLQEYKNYRDLSLKKNWITEKKNNK